LQSFNFIYNCFYFAASTITILITYFHSDLGLVRSKWLHCSLPILYYLLLVFKIGIINVVYQPMTFALSVLLATTFLKRSLLRLIILISLTYTYVFGIHGALHQRQNKSDQKFAKFELEQSQIQLSPTANLNLREFKFLDHTLDSLSISLNNKFIVIESWTEWCPPCIQAMKDLQPWFEDNKDLIDHYYLYENKNFERIRDKRAIFSFKAISDSQKIIVDPEQALHHSLQMSSYPYFAIYDSTGQLINIIKGYKASHTLKEIKDALKV